MSELVNWTVLTGKLNWQEKTQKELDEKQSMRSSLDSGNCDAEVSMGRV